MKKIVIIFSIISMQYLNGQSESKVSKLKSTLASFDNIDQISPFGTLDTFNTELELERQIDFGYIQHRFSVDDMKIKLNFISKNGIIEIGWISEYNSNKEKNMNALFFKNSHNSIQKYIKNHNTFYNTVLDEDDFREQILAEYTVGYACSEDLDFTPKMSKKAIRFTKNKNTKALHKYLTSFSSELQTLGAIGLLKINKLTAKQKQIIEHLKTRNSKIITCTGCLFGVESTFVNEIKDFE